MEHSEREKLFKKTINDHKDKIYRICYAYLYEKELVDDLYQEVLINIWNGLRNFKGNSLLSTWLYRVTLNTTITFNKKTKKHFQSLKYKIPDSNSIVEQTDTSEIEKEIRINKLMQCIQKLKKEERLIISLVLEELTYKEIAEILGVQTSNVGVRINRIKKRLLKIYENEGF